MTGRQLRALCAELDVSPRLLAALTGMHVETVYRWLRPDLGSRHIDPSGHARGLLEVLERHGARDAELGRDLHRAHSLGGPLRAIYTLLEREFGRAA